MDIVISAGPERWADITFFDGIGNQIYPPHTLGYRAIIDYISDICNEHDINSITVIGNENYISNLVNKLKENFPTVNIK